MPSVVLPVTNPSPVSSARFTMGSGYQAKTR